MRADFIERQSTLGARLGFILRVSPLGSGLLSPKVVGLRVDDSWYVYVVTTLGSVSRVSGKPPPKSPSC